MTRKKLPIGIQTFAKIREGSAHYYYVDKTPLALQLIDEGTHYFLSRPRRFGKSLFLDTLKELFEGNAALFKGLHAEHHWDWSVQYPVLRLSFGGGVLGSVADLQASLHAQLTQHEQSCGLTAQFPDARSRFADLIRHRAQQTGQRVVVLVDEYDKPILDRIEDRDTALALREVLKDFYAVIKDSDAHIRFAFLTGVSKFSKVSLFSGLNNLKDITIDPRFSALCGYTDADVDTVFAPELPGLDRDEIRRWYNGYHWTGESVYNPHGLLLYFSNRRQRATWFENGTPSFLIKLLKARPSWTPPLEPVEVSADEAAQSDVEQMPLAMLLLETGYMTLQVENPASGQKAHRLRYANQDTRTSLFGYFLNTRLPNPGDFYRAAFGMYASLENGDLASLGRSLQKIFVEICAMWVRSRPLQHLDGCWNSLFYAVFASLGLECYAEDVTNKGRIDMAVRFEGHTYLFEFKVVELVPEGKALQQLKDRGYADKYRSPGAGPVHLIGVEFSKDQRNLVAFETETLE